MNIDLTGWRQGKRIQATLSDGKIITMRDISNADEIALRNIRHAMDLKDTEASAVHASTVEEYEVRMAKADKAEQERDDIVMQGLAIMVEPGDLEHVNRVLDPLERAALFASWFVGYGGVKTAFFGGCISQATQQASTMAKRIKDGQSMILSLPSSTDSQASTSSKS